MQPLVPAEVETERLVMRRPVEADVEGLLPLFDAEVVRYLDGRVPDADDMWRAVATWIGHWEMRGYGITTWVEKATGTIVGRGGLWYPHGWPQVEVGWTIGRAWWGQGFAREAGAAALGPRLDAPRPPVGVQRHPSRQRPLPGGGAGLGRGATGGSAAPPGRARRHLALRPPGRVSPEPRTRTARARTDLVSLW